MSGKALVLAGHGSHVDPTVNGLVRGYAVRISEMDLFDEVVSAFHQGEPAFATVLDSLVADHITVVPMMTSRGYFSEVVLPRELARNQRYPSICVCRTDPVGTCPGIVSMVARLVCDRLREHDLSFDKTALVIVGHGTRRHPGSRDATFRLADSLRSRGVCSEVISGFLDDHPQVDTLLDQVTQSDVVVVPFFIGGGPHAASDVPTALGLKVHDDHLPPISGRVNGRFVVCDAAIGTDPGIIEIVVQLALGSTLQPVPPDVRKPQPQRGVLERHR